MATACSYWLSCNDFCSSRQTGHYLRSLCAKKSPARALSVLGVVVAALMPWQAQAEVPCTGHQALPTPRPETSCQTITPQIFISPDGAMHASVLPVSVNLYATPDMESRVVFRSRDGDTLTSEDYSSPRGVNGYHVYSAKWSPDSQFFAYSLTSSGGHQPWSFPIMVYSRERNIIAKFSNMIDDRPTLSGDFEFSGSSTVSARTWDEQGEIDQPVPITVDLENAFATLSLPER
jgi:hypothetical protein